MPNFDHVIDNKTVGDAFDITRTLGGIPSGLVVEDAWLTVMPNGASETETTFLFQKNITTTPSLTQGVIDNVQTFSVEAQGTNAAGTEELSVIALPTTISAGVVLQFSGGAWVTVATKALQGATTILVDPIDFPIGNGELAEYKTVRLRFKIKSADSVLIAPNLMHPYDIQITLDNGDPTTIEDGTITLRPQRTIGV